jgi:hypothetical protein
LWKEREREKRRKKKKINIKRERVKTGRLCPSLMIVECKQNRKSAGGREKKAGERSEEREREKREIQ